MWKFKSNSKSYIKENNFSFAQNMIWKYFDKKWTIPYLTILVPLFLMNIIYVFNIQHCDLLSKAKFLLRYWWMEWKIRTFALKWWFFTNVGFRFSQIHILTCFFFFTQELPRLTFKNKDFRFSHPKPSKIKF